MRWKIIIANAGIVLVVGLLSYTILLTTLSDALSDPTARKVAAERASRAADTQLTLDSLRIERWLLNQAATEPVRAVFSLGTPSARSEAATAQANRVMDAAAKAPEFYGMRPTLVAFVDQRAVGLGRDNSATLMRGDPLGSTYPSLLGALQAGVGASAMWINPERQEQLFVSYAPITSEAGTPVGALLIGTPINDDRLGRLSELTSGHPLVLAIGGHPAAGQERATSIVATTPGFSRDSVAQERLIETSNQAVQRGGTVVRVAGDNHVVGASPLSGYGEVQGALAAVVPTSMIGNVGAKLWPIWGVVALGIVMVVVVGSMLGAYISRPISQLEEGLLTIINGQTDMRFELEHEELGGLVFRINSLLNVLTGVTEGDDDPQRPPD